MNVNDACSNTLEAGNSNGKIDTQIQASTSSSPWTQRTSRYQDTLSLSYKSYFRAVSSAFVNLLPFPWRARQPRCVLLGRHYDLSEAEDNVRFMADFKSRILLTYRHHFPPLNGSQQRMPPAANDESTEKRNAAKIFCDERRLNDLFRGRSSRKADCNLTSDSGWGCMIRVFQMALAQSLLSILVGRNWRRPVDRHLIDVNLSQLTDDSLGKADNWAHILEADLTTFNPTSVYPWTLVPILAQFRDSSAARFSIHRIVATGRMMLGIAHGEWFGPTSCSQCLTALIRGTDLVELSHVCEDLASRPEHLGALEIQDIMLNTIRIGAHHSDNGEICSGEVHALFKVQRITHQPLTAEVSQSSPRLREVSAGLQEECECDVDKGIARAVSDPGLQIISEPEDASGAEMRQGEATPECLSPAPSLLQPRVYDAVVIFLSLRLGLDCFNLRYQPFLQSCFGLRQFQGLAGGGPLTSAYWFVAANDEHLYFLDPHSPVQQAMIDVDRDLKIERISADKTRAVGVPYLLINDTTMTREATDSMFFPSTPKQLPWRALNPSLTLVFLCRSGDDFEDLLVKLAEVDSEEVLHVTSARRMAIPETPERHREDSGFLLL